MEKLRQSQEDRQLKLSAWNNQLDVLVRYYITYMMTVNSFCRHCILADTAVQSINTIIDLILTWYMN